VTELRITGAEEFGRLSTRLNAADKTIQREFSTALNRATKPIKAKAKASALSTLPSSGGLAARVAGARLSVRRTTRGKNIGIRIVAGSAKQQLAGIDKGSVKHPTFGNRSAWVTQRVNAGWFTRPMLNSASDVRRELLKAMDDVADKLDG
jgi:hypothetical protein